MKRSERLRQDARFETTLAIAYALGAVGIGPQSSWLYRGGDIALSHGALALGLLLATLSLLTARNALRLYRAAKEEASHEYRRSIRPRV